MEPLSVLLLLFGALSLGYISVTLDAMFVSWLPEVPLWVFPLLALGFALTNAAMEEIIFRGIMMEALDNAFGAGHLSNVIQAFSFGAVHYQSGFPNGVCGFVMVFVYGLMLGILRRQSRGILAPWMTHIAADITIFMILAGI
jgi:membrane protease YdiL (CAAX protease family)